MRIKNASIEIQHSLLNDTFTMQRSCCIVRCVYNHTEIQSKTLLNLQLFLCIVFRQMEAKYIAKLSCWISIFLPFYLLLFVNVCSVRCFCFCLCSLLYFQGLYVITQQSLMVVQLPCLVCNRAVAKNHRTVQCDLCDSWVHIACNNLNVYTYQTLQKGKSP